MIINLFLLIPMIRISIGQSVKQCVLSFILVKDCGQLADIDKIRYWQNYHIIYVQPHNGWLYIFNIIYKTMTTKINKTADSNNDGKIGWKELDFRDRVAYTMAIILIVSGIIMAFCCFFMTDDHNITDGVLFYTAQTFVTGGSLLGIGVWVKGKFGEMNNYINKRFDEHND